MRVMPIKGVFFDLGGTLFSYRHVPRQHAELLATAAGRLGLADARPLKKAYGTALTALSASYAQKPYYLHRDLFKEAFEHCVALVGQRADEALTHWYLDAHQTCVFGSLELKSDCLETLKALRAQGLYVSIVSNIDEEMLTTLVAREALGPLLDHWTSSEEAQSCKPHRGFFEHCLRKSGLPAAELLFVGDSPEHDIEGAAAMGMQTALILDEGMPPPLQAGRASVAPQHTISHLRELTRIVER